MNSTVNSKNSSGLKKTRKDILAPSPIRATRRSVDFEYGACDTYGRPKNTIENMLIYFFHIKRWKDAIRYDLFNQETIVNGKRLDDSIAREIWIDLEQNSGMVNIPKTVLWEAIMAYAEQNKFDPVIDFFEDLKWDGEERMKKWIHISCNVTDSEYHECVGFSWLLALANRQIRPGSEFRNVLTLIGGQKLGKTSLFYTLLEPFTKESVKLLTGDLANPDTIRPLVSGSLIVNMDEGASFGKKDNRGTKTFISKRMDEVRFPYERSSRVFPRRFVLGMTENNVDALNDPTGGDRYWIVDIAEMVNFKWLEENRLQLLAEAYYRAKSGEPYILPDEFEAGEIQEIHRQADPLEEKVYAYLCKSRDFVSAQESFSITTTKIWEEAFKMDQHSIQMKDSWRISDIMKALGFTQSRERNEEGQNVRVWKLTKAGVKKVLRNAPKHDDVLTLSQQFKEF